MEMDMNSFVFDQKKIDTISQQMKNPKEKCSGAKAAEEMVLEAFKEFIPDIENCSSQSYRMDMCSLKFKCAIEVKCIASITGFRNSKFFEDAQINGDWLNTFLHINLASKHADPVIFGGHFIYVHGYNLKRYQLMSICDVLKGNAEEKELTEILKAKSLPSYTNLISRDIALMKNDISSIQEQLGKLTNMMKCLYEASISLPTNKSLSQPDIDKESIVDVSIDLNDKVQAPNPSEVIDISDVIPDEDDIQIIESDDDIIEDEIQTAAHRRSLEQEALKILPPVNNPEDNLEKVLRETFIECYERIRDTYITESEFKDTANKIARNHPEYGLKAITVKYDIEPFLKTFKDENGKKCTFQKRYHLNPDVPSETTRVLSMKTETQFKKLPRNGNIKYTHLTKEFQELDPSAIDFQKYEFRFYSISNATHQNDLRNRGTESFLQRPEFLYVVLSSFNERYHIPPKETDHVVFTFNGHEEDVNMGESLNYLKRLNPEYHKVITSLFEEHHNFKDPEGEYNSFMTALKIAIKNEKAFKDVYIWTSTKDERVSLANVFRSLKMTSCKNRLDPNRLQTYKNHWSEITQVLLENKSIILGRHLAEYETSQKVADGSRYKIENCFNYMNLTQFVQ